MSDNLFDEEARLFNEKVAELVEMYQKQHPTMSDAAARLLAEEMTDPLFFFKQEKQKRPN